MKRSLNLKNLTAIMLVASVVFFSSCVKNRNDGAVDFSQLAPIMQIPEGGLKNFAQSALLFDATHTSDTAYFRANYAATTVAPSDIAVTMTVDDAARLAYNASHTDQYEKAPDSIYKFFVTTTTVMAGQSYSDPVKLTVYPNKINSSKSYMIAITITNASGVNISGNFGTIYYHIIGNPLSGDYQDYGQRFNFTGAVAWSGPAAGLGLATAPGVPSVNPPAGNTGITTYNFVTTFSPVNAQTVTGTMGNVPDPSGGAAFYFVTGLDPTFATMDYDFAATWYAGYSNTVRYKRGYVPPSPTQKPAFRLITQYNNTTGGAGNDRIIDETFLHL